MKFIIKLLLTFFIVVVFAQSGKTCTFVHPSVAKYHIEFLNGNEDSVLRFQEQFPEIIKDRYVYIAYLGIYKRHESYKELLRHN